MRSSGAGHKVDGKAQAVQVLLSQMGVGPSLGRCAAVKV